MLTKLTPDVREYAARLEVEETAVVQAGMDEKSEQLRAQGSEVYRPA